MPNQITKGKIKMNNVRITGNINKTMRRSMIEWLKTKQKPKS